MSARGGGRGGRGGRGGGRGGGIGPRRGPPGTNWGDDLHRFVTRTPQENYPEYSIRVPAPITDEEERVVNRYLLFRQQVQDGPLYTRSKTLVGDPVHPPQTYTRDQWNELYQSKNKGSVDPFTAVPSYGDRFRPVERKLPDWSRFPVNKSLFPIELHQTLDDADVPKSMRFRSSLANGGQKKKTLHLPSAARTIDNLHHPQSLLLVGDAAVDEESRQHVLELLNAAENENTDDVPNLEMNLRADAEEGLLDEDDEPDDEYEEEEDDAANDYNAQEYWEAENNEDDGDYADGGEGDDGDFY